MKISDCFPSKYLKATDLSGRQVKVKIESVKLEQMADSGDTKPVLYFDGKDRGLVLNRTNATVLAEHFGDDTDKWTGVTIELATHRVNFQGRMADGITIRVPVPVAVTEFADPDIPF